MVPRREGVEGKLQGENMYKYSVVANILTLINEYMHLAVLSDTVP